jgi:hypothetical protein
MFCVMIFRSISERRLKSFVRAILVLQIEPTLSLSCSLRKLIALIARRPISLALSISESCNWNDMYCIHKNDEFGEPRRRRSKSAVD